MTIGSMAGYCTIHKIDKMFVGLEDATEPVCVRCKADATPKIGRTQTVEDPGEDFNGYVGGGKAKVQIVEANGVGKMAVAALRVGGSTLESIVANAVLNLNALPMPKDIKQFKKIQKVIKTLQSLVENQNG